MKQKQAAAANDFDFIYGNWTIQNQLLKERLNHCTEWQEFEAEYDAFPIIDGLGNVDRFKAAINGNPFEGASIRLFNEDKKQWSIYWVSVNSPTLDDPMVGGFNGNRGEFFGEARLNDKDVLVRFLWHNIDPTHARWEQAFSADKGGTWETNWIMDFERNC